MNDHNVATCGHSNHWTDGSGQCLACECDALRLRVAGLEAEETRQAKRMALHCGGFGGIGAEEMSNKELNDPTAQTAEQQARYLIERLGIWNAQSFSAGELVELANLIAANEIACDRIGELEAANARLRIRFRSRSREIAVMKAELCKEFCEEIKVHQVPFGLAVSTGFAGPTGDQIGFYISKPDSNGLRIIQDDGLTVFGLEAVGADIDLGTRSEVFHALLNEYGFEFDEEDQCLRSKLLTDAEIPKKALSFVAFMLRVQDIALLVKERKETVDYFDMPIWPYLPHTGEYIRALREAIEAEMKP